jgi:hypothetical protein
MLDPTQLLTGIPGGLRTPLISSYIEIVRNYAESRFEPAELNGGKLCEVVYTIIDGATVGVFPAVPQKPANLVDACRAIEQRPANPARVGDRSLRILIPRLLPYLYEIRNNRGVGHVGGDVNPNYSDATAVLSCAKWIMAELVRIFHAVSLEEAQVAIDALVEKKHPIIWEMDGVKRVLDPNLNAYDQVLLLLYSSNDWITDGILRDWIEYKNVTNFRDKILTPLHRERAVEYESDNGRVRITPRGNKDVEARILPKYSS